MCQAKKVREGTRAMVQGLHETHDASKIVDFDASFGVPHRPSGNDDNRRLDGQKSGLKPPCNCLIVRCSFGTTSSVCPCRRTSSPMAPRAFCIF